MELLLIEKAAFEKSWKEKVQEFDFNGYKVKNGWCYADESVERGWQIWKDRAEMEAVPSKNPSVIRLHKAANALCQRLGLFGKVSAGEVEVGELLDALTETDPTSEYEHVK